MDNILALMGLSILLGLAKTGSVSAVSLGLMLLKVVGFFVLTIGVGELIIPRFAGRLTDKEAKGFTFALIVALGLGFLADWAGLHLIIGAFLGGQFVRREIMDERIYERIADRFYGISYGFLVPIFFVSLSFHLKIQWTWSFLWFTLVLILAATVGKVAGCGLAARLFRNSWGPGGRGGLRDERPGRGGAGRGHGGGGAEPRAFRGRGHQSTAFDRGPVRGHGSDGLCDHPDSPHDPEVGHP